MAEDSNGEGMSNSNERELCLICRTKLKERWNGLETEDRKTDCSTCGKFTATWEVRQFYHTYSEAIKNEIKKRLQQFMDIEKKSESFFIIDMHLVESIRKHLLNNT